MFPCNNQSRPNNWFEDFWKESPGLAGLSIDIDTAFSPLLRPVSSGATEEIKANSDIILAPWKPRAGSKLGLLKVPLSLYINIINIT